MPDAAPARLSTGSPESGGSDGIVSEGGATTGGRPPAGPRKGPIARIAARLSAAMQLVRTLLRLERLNRSPGEPTWADTRAPSLMFDPELKNMVPGMAMFDAEERIVVADHRYAEMFGLTADQVKPGTSLREVVACRAARGHYPGLSAEEAYRMMRGRAMRTEPTHVLNRLADGRVIAAFVQPKAAGGWVVTHHDVTERENLHGLLAQQNALLDAALNNMSQGLCMLDAERRLIVCNKVYLEMYGLTEDSVKPGTTARELLEMRHAKGYYADQDSEQFVADWLDDPRPEVTRLQHLSDGRIISVRCRKLSDGTFIVMHEDITERHRLEQTERETRELLSAVLDAAPAAIICLDLDQKAMVWSRGAEDMFGYTAEEAIGRRYRVVPEGKEKEFDRLFQRAVAGEIFRDVPVQRRCKDGTLVDVSLASAAVHSRDGTVRGITYALNDMTEKEKLRKRIEEQHEQLDIALNNMSQGIAMFDAEQRLVVCNNLYAKMFGLAPDQVQPGTPIDKIQEYRQANGCSDLGSVPGSLDRRAGSFGFMRSGVQKLADGRIIHVFCRKTASGGHVITHQDITESERLNARLEQQHRLLKEQEEQLRAQNFQLDAALNNMVQGLAMFDAERRLVMCNTRYAEMYALTDEEVSPGTPLRAILERRLAKGGLMAEGAEELSPSILSDPGAGGVSHIVAELEDGRFISVSVQAMAGGGVLTTHQDITEQRRSEAKIVHMALHDTLTGLPNRALLNERLEHSLTRVKRGEMVAIQILDLDYFKSVNDTLGHAAGDKLLQMVAERLRTLVRETDTVARMGGDEFAILQVAIDQPADATSLAHRVIEVVSAPYEIDGHQVVIGTSVGIAVGPADGTTPDQLSKNADLALYRAKGDGRGTFCFFEPEMDAQMQARRAMEYDLRKGLVAGEFELYYQPSVHIGSDEITGLEALIRWNHPKLGMIPPAKFIPLAEEIGFIVTLGEWALREACMAAAKWPEPLVVSVNISPAQFRNTGMMQVVTGALAASGLPPGRLELEITEMVLMGDGETTLGTLYQLRDIGVRIAMDDFGTGYSSLSYLQSFPFDKIKIDRSFVKDITEGGGSLNIVRAVTAMAQGLGMTTTAEGVETNAQLDMIRSEGCTEMQGFLFSHPLPAREALLFLRRRYEDKLGAAKGQSAA